jgi:hypothetical protein
MYGNVPEYIFVEVGYLSVALCCSVPVIRHSIVKEMYVFHYQLLLLLRNNYRLSLSTLLISSEIPIDSTADGDKQFPDLS